MLIAELGVDMSVFPSARHCAAWAGVCPGNNESGGKRRGHSTRKGNVHLTTALVQAAHGASHAKGTYLKDKYWRLKARKGPARAAMAIAHKILIAAYHVLARAVDYKDLGATFLDQASASIAKRALVKRLERLGYNVSLKPMCRARTLFSWQRGGPTPYARQPALLSRFLDFTQAISSSRIATI